VLRFQCSPLLIHLVTSVTLRVLFTVLAYCSTLTSPTLYSDTFLSVWSYTSSSLSISHFQDVISMSKPQHFPVSSKSFLALFSFIITGNYAIFSAVQISSQVSFWCPALPPSSPCAFSPPLSLLLSIRSCTLSCCWGTGGWCPFYPNKQQWGGFSCFHPTLRHPATREEESPSRHFHPFSVFTSWKHPAPISGHLQDLAALAFVEGQLAPFPDLT